METKHTPGPWLTDDLVHLLNEKHGWFKYGDAQSSVSKQFAQDAIDMHERIRRAALDLFKALKSSNHTLHPTVNGEECLCSQCAFVKLRDAAIAKATGEQE